MKKNLLIPIVLLVVALIAFEAVGSIQQLLGWPDVMTLVVNSVFVVVVALILSRMASLVFKLAVMRRLVNYLILAGAGIMIFFMFQENLIAIGISLGIIAVAFTFIFQSPILNLVGWVYITIGAIYREGDRIRVGNFKGDVVDINPMRTKIFEIGGEFTVSDLPSGRIITVPNSLLLSEPVSNFTKDVPYVWVDVPFELSYETDFDFVEAQAEKIIRRRLKGKLETIRERYEKAIETYHVEDEPFIDVNFSLIPSGSWIEFRVTFPVDPKEQAMIVTEITEDIIRMFNKHPEKAQFPKGRTR